MITILLQKILAALTQLLGDIKIKLNTIKDNLDDLIVVATAAGPIASFTTNISRPLLSCIVDIPESISGTDTVIVTQTGANLADASIVYPEYPEVTEDGKTCRKVTCGSSKTVTLKFKPNTQYTVKMAAKCVTNGSPTVDSRGFVFFYSDNSQSYINFGKVSADWTDYTLTSTSGKTVVAVGTFTSDWRLNIFVDNSKFMLVEGTTATTYEPYSATTKTVSLPETVYGGEVDVISGKITKTYEADDLGDMSWSYESDEGYFYSDSITDIKSGSENCLCESGYTYDAALSVNKTFTISGTQIRFRDDTYSAAPDFKTAVTGIDFIYELAEADTDSITPEVITAINGVNNIFSDSGDITVEYLKLYKED